MTYRLRFNGCRRFSTLGIAEFEKAAADTVFYGRGFIMCSVNGIEHVPMEEMIANILNREFDEQQAEAAVATWEGEGGQ